MWREPQLWLTLPVQPLLNPEPWVQPKYKDFPAGKLLIETCGTWCWSFDYGPNGTAPITTLKPTAASACRFGLRNRSDCSTPSTLKTRQTRPTSGEISPNDLNE